jgi:ankyrin repeat protein
LALKNGHTETVKVFTEVVSNSTLRDPEKTQLLAAKFSNGTPGLFLALKNGHTETVKAFAEVVSVSNLSANVKKELLSGIAGTSPHARKKYW